MNKGCSEHQQAEREGEGEPLNKVPVLLGDQGVCRSGVQKAGAQHTLGSLELLSRTWGRGPHGKSQLVKDQCPSPQHHLRSHFLVGL